MLVDTVIATFSLDELDLLRFDGFQSPRDNLLRTKAGKVYDVSTARPYTDLFDSESFSFSPDGSDGLTVYHKRSGQSFPLSVYRIETSDTSIVQVVKDETSSIVYGEVRETGRAEDSFFMATDRERSARLSTDEATSDDVGTTLLSFRSSDIDRAKLAENYDFGEAPPIAVSDRHKEFANSGNEGNRRLANGDCSSYQVVPVAIVYDSPLCGVYGSHEATIRRLMTIAASASALYERDMCVQLRLTDVHSPDTRCGGDDSSTFGDFFYENACGDGESLLDDFTLWTRRERGRSGINNDSLLHYFTGVPRPTNSRSIGCAWIGVVRR